MTERARTPTESSRVADLMSKLSLDEKVDLVTGLDMWHTRGLAAKFLRMRT